MDAIVIESVTKHFRPGWTSWLRAEKRRATAALSDVSLRIPAGSVQVLLGPNGSGKTTLLKLIATMLLPDSGRIVIDGLDAGHNENHIRRKTGFALANERSFFPRLTARENLDFFAAMDDVPRRLRPHRIQELLMAARLTDHSDKPVGTLSTGMYQQLAIVRALVKRPSILLLDEPSRSLDPGSATELHRLVRELSHTGVTIVLATHSFQEAAQLGGQVAILDRGRLIHNFHLRTPSAEHLRAVYFEKIGEDREPLESFAELPHVDHALAG